MKNRAMYTWTALAGLLAAGMPAIGQATEFTLEEDGAWAQTAAPQEGTDEYEMWQARRMLAEGNPGKAADLLSNWLEANGRSRSPYLAEAYFLRGEARLANDREYKALFDYEQVIRDFSSSEFYQRAVDREYEIGIAYIGGLRRRFLGIRLESARPTGEELLIRVQERVPGSDLAERAALDLADHYYNRRELKLAAEMYSIFRVNYPSSTNLRYAMLREIECNIARFKGPRYNGAGLLDAKLLIEGYREQYPGESAQTGITDGLEAWVDESAAEQSLETALWYLKTNDEASARFVMTRLINRHAGSDAARRAVRMMQDRGWIKSDSASEPEVTDEASES